MPADKLKIVYRAVKGLAPYAANARTHSPDQIAQIAASIEEFGWTNPILVDEAGGIIAGHGRLEAALFRGQETVPTITLAGLSDRQKRALVLADNQLALNAGWDTEILRTELVGLHAEEFDMALLGFSADDLSAAMGLEAAADNAASAGPSFRYEEKFAVLVDCADEAAQRHTFERLTAMGLSCKVLVN